MIPSMSEEDVALKMDFYGGSSMFVHIDFPNNWKSGSERYSQVLLEGNTHLLNKKKSTKQNTQKGV